MTPEQAVPGQMRDLGLDPDAVRTVVMTHLHSDHASGISQFPGRDLRRQRRRVAGGGVRRGQCRATSATSSTTPSTTG